MRQAVGPGIDRLLKIGGLALVRGGGTIVMAAEEQGAKTLRVTMPPELHLRLRSLKIVTGKGMSETVVEALEEYFERLEREAATKQKGK